MKPDTLLKDRYDDFMRMYRQWSNMAMAKRAGRSHIPDGLKITGPGECALLCPACPHPGKNLPEDWKDAPAEKRYLFLSLVTMLSSYYSHLN